MTAGLAAAALISSCCGNKDIPLVYDQENTASVYPAPEMPAFADCPVQEELPDPLTFCNGKPVKNFAQWEKRRAEILALLQNYEVGTKPVVPREDVKAHMAGDTMVVEVTANGETLVLHTKINLPEGDGPFPVIIGMGGPSGSLPRDIVSSRPIATMGFNFSEVMAHTQKRGSEPINRLYPELVENGAYCMWPWGVSRLIDGLEILKDELPLDLAHIAVTGCSFAGKMALWSGAFDERVALTIAQEPGGGGAAAWRISETLGHVETLGNTSFEWFKESMREFEKENVNRIPVDHNELCALVAPRALLVLGNTDYEWLADESGYRSCKDARRVWEFFGIADRMGYAVHGGHMHCMLPKEEYPAVENFIDKFLFGKDVPTDVQDAPAFQN